MFSAFKDNRGAVQPSKNPVSNLTFATTFYENSSTKQGEISVVHVTSECQYAEKLTKALAFDFFAIYLRFLVNLDD